MDGIQFEYSTFSLCSLCHRNQGSKGMRRDRLLIIRSFVLFSESAELPTFSLFSIGFHQFQTCYWKYNESFLYRECEDEEGQSDENGEGRKMSCFALLIIG